MRGPLVYYGAGDMLRSFRDDVARILTENGGRA